MIRERIDLAMIKLDRADGLRGRIDRRRFGAQTAKGRVLFVRADPGRDRGGGDSTTGFRLEALGGVVERIAEVVERQRLHHQADGVGLVAQRGRAGREGAFACAAAPELDDLELFLANAFAGYGMAAAVRAGLGCLFECGTVAGRRGERDIQVVSAEPITGVEFWKVR